MPVQPRRHNPRWHLVTAAARRLRLGTDRDVPVDEIADTLGIPHHITRDLVANMTELRLVRSDMSPCNPPTLIRASAAR